MLNNDKINVMTKLAIFEQNAGKEVVRKSKYYKTDYVRFQVLKTVVMVTIGYLLILAMIGIYQAEYLISKAVTLDYIRIGQYILGFYIMFITIYVTGSIIGYSFQYDRSRKKLSRYYKTLQKLHQIHKEENSNG